MEELSPDERCRVYKLPGLDVRFGPDRPLGIPGLFAEVAGEAEDGLSYCNPSPRSV